MFVLHPSPCALLQAVGVGAGGGQDSSTGALKPPALVATLLVSLHQSDPLGLNATPLPQDSSLVETPLAENKPRKRQLSEEQPSGNGVKKPKVSVSGLGRAGSWQGPCVLGFGSQSGGGARSGAARPAPLTSDL